MKFTRACWSRSGTVGKRDSSCATSATAPTSAVDSPVQSVAHGSPPKAAKAVPVPPSTALASWKSPWPKRTGSAGWAAEAERGTTQMKRAWVVLPAMRTGKPRRSSRKRDPAGHPGRFRKHGTVTRPCTSRSTGPLEKFRTESIA